MIRRDHQHDWLLIEQVEHARLAWEIAARWGNDQWAALPATDILLGAIEHHDDGWKEWAEAPKVDPETGQPRNFTEMPMAVATDIWERSIAECANRHALSGIWVSRHFCFLAEMANDNRSEDSQESHVLDRFLYSEHQRQDELTGQARRQDIDGLEKLIETGFHFVQFFDALSLWLCCSTHLERYDADVPTGGSISFTPQDDQPADNHTEIVAAPYPLSVDRLDLSVSARRIPARRYTNETLTTALSTSTPQRLEWVIRRPVAKS